MFGNWLLSFLLLFFLSLSLSNTCCNCLIWPHGCFLHVPTLRKPRIRIPCTVFLQWRGNSRDFPALPPAFIHFFCPHVIVYRGNAICPIEGWMGGGRGPQLLLSAWAAGSCGFNWGKHIWGNARILIMEFGEFDTCAPLCNQRLNQDLEYSYHSSMFSCVWPFPTPPLRSATSWFLSLQVGSPVLEFHTSSSVSGFFHSICFWDSSSFFFWWISTLFLFIAK